MSSQNQLTPAQRQALLPVMESVLRVMESDKPSVNDVNTLMIQVRDLLKQVPEGYLPNLGQLGFEGLDNLDLDTLKNVALKETGDIAITENGQDKIVTSFGNYSTLRKKSIHFESLGIVSKFCSTFFIFLSKELLFLAARLLSMVAQGPGIFLHAQESLS